MIIHIDPLYKQRMEPAEYGKMRDAMIKFEKDLEEYHGHKPSNVETSFLWMIETDRDGHKIDVLSLRFSVGAHNSIYQLANAWKSEDVAVCLPRIWYFLLLSGSLNFNAHDNPDDILRLIDFNGESADQPTLCHNNSAE